MILIIVLSENYASSTWCLDESILAQPIGNLGNGLRPSLVRRPPNSNNIVYNIVFSFEKKKIHTYLWFAEEKITKGPFLIWKKNK